MNPYLLEMIDISKSFSGIKALKNVSIRVKPGEVHGLIGENGAGKSTLFKVLAGVYERDSGEIIYEGDSVHFKSPKEAVERGISVIYQELSILPELSVAENIFIGRLPKHSSRSLRVDWEQCYEICRRLLKKLQIDISPRMLAGDLKVAQQQMVEIVKALSHEIKLIIMDEPTTALTSREIQSLMETIRMLKQDGVSVLYVSHKLEEIKQICDVVTIFRDGMYVDTLDVQTTEIPQWVRLMVGRDVKEMYPKQVVPLGNEFIRFNNFCNGKQVQQVGFNVLEGEILGLFGLVGAGRTELARAIIGADSKESGEILIRGESISIDSPRYAIRNKIGFVPEDRKDQGLVLQMTVKENITLSNLKSLIKVGKINLKQEIKVAKQFVKDLKIVTPSINQQVRNLSGGNQQKVVISKGLFLGCSLLIIDEPTKGVDVAAKVEIYNIITEFVKQKKSVIMISSEVEELIGMCDRIIVMREGQVRGALLRNEFDKNKIMDFATGQDFSREGVYSDNF